MVSLQEKAEDIKVSLPVNPSSICFTSKKQIHPGSQYYKMSLREKMTRSNRFDNIQFQLNSDRVINIPLLSEEPGSGGIISTSIAEKRESKDAGCNCNHRTPTPLTPECQAFDC